MKQSMRRRIQMKTLKKSILVALAVGVLTVGVQGLAMASQNGPIPDYSTPLDTAQPGWIHDVHAGGYMGYPPDYSNPVNTSGWGPVGQAGTETAAQPAVPIAPSLGTK